MSTAKHYEFCSGPMDHSLVTALPGIGPVYGGKLNQAGYCMAKDIYKVFKSYNFDRGLCENWLYRVCGANSRYSSMCYEALKEWHNQFGETSYSPNQQKQQSYRHETPEFGFLKKIPLLQSPERILNTSVQQSPASSRGSDISKAEVMQMMDEFRKKQDAMASQIRILEQESSKKDSCIKTLETKIETMNKKTTELQKQNDAQIVALTNKLRDMDRTEKYKNISSSVYLLSQKFEDVLTELNEEKQKSTIHSYVKALETRIQQIERKTTNIQKELNEKFSNANIHQYKEMSSSINLLTQKCDDLIQQQNERKQDKISTQKSTGVTIKQLEHQIQNLTMDLQKIIIKNTKTKKPLNRDELLVESVRKNNTICKLKEVKLPTVTLKNEIVKQVKLKKEHDNSKEQVL